MNQAKHFSAVLIQETENGFVFMATIVLYIIKYL